MSASQSKAPGARMALGVAIFQDLFVIAFLVLMPLLLHAPGEHAALGPELGVVVGKGVIFVAIAFVLARWVIPSAA